MSKATGMIVDGICIAAVEGLTRDDVERVVREELDGVFGPRDDVANLLATVERHKAHVEGRGPFHTEIDADVLRELISASRKLDAWRREPHSHEENVEVDKARAWLKANGLPTEYGT